MYKTKRMNTTTNPPQIIINVPTVVTDDFLNELAYYINTEYLERITYITIKNIAAISNEIEDMSNRIVMELDIINTRNNVNKQLYDDIVIMYNQYRHLFLNKLRSINIK